jgi:flagellar export protein FliJ
MPIIRPSLLTLLKLRDQERQAAQQHMLQQAAVVETFRQQLHQNHQERARVMAAMDQEIRQQLGQSDPELPQWLENNRRYLMLLDRRASEFQQQLDAEQHVLHTLQQQLQAATLRHKQIDFLITKRRQELSQQALRQEVQQIEDYVQGRHARLPAE